MKLTIAQALNHPHRDCILPDEIDIDIEATIKRFAWCVGAEGDSALMAAAREDVRHDGALCLALSTPPRAFAQWLSQDDHGVYAMTDATGGGEWVYAATDRVAGLKVWPSLEPVSFQG